MDWSPGVDLCLTLIGGLVAYMYTKVINYNCWISSYLHSCPSERYDPYLTNVSYFNQNCSHASSSFFFHSCSSCLGVVHSIIAVVVSWHICQYYLWGTLTHKCPWGGRLAVQAPSYGAPLNHSLRVCVLEGGEGREVMISPLKVVEEKKWSLCHGRLTCTCMCIHNMQNVYVQIYTDIHSDATMYIHVYVVDPLTPGAVTHHTHMPILLYLHTNTSTYVTSLFSKPLPAPLIGCPTWCIHCSVFYRTGSFMSLWRSIIPLSTALKQGTTNNSNLIIRF